MSFEERTEILIFSGLLAVSILFLIFILFFTIGSASGKSMLPTVHDGDIFLGSKYFDRNSILIGSIITYQNPQDPFFFIAHRVIQKGLDDKGIFYICKGDNNIIEDPWQVRSEQIKEIILVVQPLSAWIFQFGLTSLLIASVLSGVKVLCYMKEKGGDRHEIIG